MVAREREEEPSDGDRELRPFLDDGSKPTICATQNDRVCCFPSYDAPETDGSRTGGASYHCDGAMQVALGKHVRS